MQTIKIAITGPESTGKTSLGQALVASFGGILVEEYARAYIAQLDRNYNLEDILHIAQKQNEQIQQALAQKPRFLFADTELIVTKIWAENAFGTVPKWIEDNIKQQVFDLYLLSNIDLAWEADPQREHGKPEERVFLFGCYQQALRSYGFPYAIISGTGKKRTGDATEVIKRTLQEKF